MAKQREDEKERKVEKNFIISILILIALIIIIFLLIREFGFIDHKPRIPTGNVDIFDINFNCDNCCNKCNDNTSNNTQGTNKPNNNTNNNITNNNNNDTDKPNNDTNNNVNNNTNKPNDNTNNNDDNDKPSETPEEEETGVTVFDEDTKYAYDTPLNIFTHTAYYVVEDKIAPGSENAYQFVIRNNNEFNIKYDIDMMETNDYNINMRYRLKLNNTYVVGNSDSWVTYEELQQADIALAAKTYDVYTLEWKWFEGSNDTEIGTNVNSKYKLDIKIFAVGIN